MASHARPVDRHRVLLSRAVNIPCAGVTCKGLRDTIRRGDRTDPRSVRSHAWNSPRSVAAVTTGVPAIVGSVLVLAPVLAAPATSTPAMDRAGADPHEGNVLNAGVAWNSSLVVHRPL